MIIDTIIVALFCAVVFVLGLILWRASEPKFYEPEKLLSRGAFDSRHHHFTPHEPHPVAEHHNAPPAPVAPVVASNTRGTTDPLADVEWLKPQTPTVQPATISSKSSDRRRCPDRRTTQVEVAIDRRQGNRRSVAPAYA
ncbi:hypothetical protein [Mariprofundus ferrooxydans]|uniref:Uncharacterized protein n=1 Tax=Mariprofundus ferrooxydans PV-1 TaxID=314345 RepID=Q0F291_9PROT|nr:hypothetical protein [Mariprofundus ferrooxydans]EAU55659.1 hypothetical protein SPV1_01887 [Mariprofundus ferrooxydans PV-1]KON48610.1 hypothetical protein AL013_01155 [Mariprofundus ferrooxydans]